MQEAEQVGVLKLEPGAAGYEQAERRGRQVGPAGDRPAIPVRPAGAGTSGGRAAMPSPSAAHTRGTRSTTPSAAPSGPTCRPWLRCAAMLGNRRRLRDRPGGTRCTCGSTWCRRTSSWLNCCPRRAGEHSRDPLEARPASVVARLGHAMFTEPDQTMCVVVRLGDLTDILLRPSRAVPYRSAGPIRRLSDKPRRGLSLNMCSEREEMAICRLVPCAWLGGRSRSRWTAVGP